MTDWNIVLADEKLSYNMVFFIITGYPNKNEQMMRYYGYYSNKSRGLRTKAGTDSEVAALIDSDVSQKAFRKN